MKSSVGTIHGMKVVDYELTSFVDNQDLAEHLNVAGDAQREGNFERADEVLRQVLVDYALIEIPIEVLCPLPVRALNALYNAIRSNSVADLLKCTLKDTRHWKNFGATSRTIMGNRMRTLKINLAGQHDYRWIKPFNERRPRIDHLRLLPTFLSSSDVEDT